MRQGDAQWRDIVNWTTFALFEAHMETDPLAELSLQQKNVPGEGGTWPIATEVLLGYANTEPERLRVQFAGEKAVVPAAAGKACPRWVPGFSKYPLDIVVTMAAPQAPVVFMLYFLQISV